ncbi:MAG: esterase-like activity of phytase family protein [Bacteroidetes bacterium]|nr:esterase-like activity of phytase family protein [Bacteroidota bacterium]
MKINFKTALIGLSAFAFAHSESTAQISLLQDYKNYTSASIGTFQNVNFREAGFSGLYPIANTNGKEFWTVSDRGVNVDAKNANPSTCRPTYDKIYGFPNYAPKIHRIRVNGDSIQILQTIPLKRPGGTTATGIINPTGYGSTAAEVASTDTVQDCANFASKIAAKDIWGIDSEGIAVDRDGNFWICEEGGPTIWKVAPNGVVMKRYTPYANLPGAQPEDMAIDTVFKYRKNNRGFEGIAIAPNGKVYAIIQSPILFPTQSVGENTRIHRILEIDPVTNAQRMFVYLNDGIIGSGGNQIRLRDWKIGDMVAINNNEFLVLEAAARGTSDIKRMYMINISGATNVTSGLYSGVTLEALVDATGLTANGITPVTKTLFMDLLANGWDPVLDKAEGLAIINDSTIAIGNDNDYGQTTLGGAEDGVAVATTNLSHVVTYRLSGANKLSNFQSVEPLLSQGVTGPSTIQTPYLLPSIPGATFTSILSAGETVGSYKLAGLGDGLGAYDNNDGTFTLLMNHEMGATAGVVRAHGSTGAFVSKWVINKNNLSVVSGTDLIQSVNLWNGTGYTTYNSGSPMTTGFGRFCSADLPAVSAFYNSATGLGTQERIFMNGEESGPEGRMFAHIASGPNAGVSYELPYLGKFSSENNVACPSSGDKTVVAGMDDATPGQVYFYIGTKTNTGTEIEKAGLSNGRLYGVAVTGLLAETSGSIPSAGTTFTLADLGQVQNMTGAAINTASNTAGVTTFLRPEDGAWDPSNPNDFYFVTTNSFTSPSRLWKLHFTNVLMPELGGTITAVLDGTEGQKMLDNLTIDNYGHVLMQEDPGNQTHLAKVWQYTIATDAIVEIGTHNPDRFLTGGSSFLTQDEESSGIIDMQGILGAGKFLLFDQAHYNFGNTEVAEGGQLLAFYNPATYYANPEINVAGNNVIINDGDLTPSSADSTNYGSVTINTNLVRTYKITNEGPGSLVVNSLTIAGTNASDFSVVNAPSLPLTIAANASQLISVQFTPSATGVRTASIVVNNNDYNEAAYDYLVQGNGVCTVPNALVTTSGNTTFCPGDSVVFTAPVSSTYLWSTGATSQSITVYTAGNYTVQVTDANGCSNTSAVNSVSLNSLPATPLISVSGNVLTSTFADSYQWYLDGVLISGATSQSYTATASGDYTVVTGNAAGCEAESAITNLTVTSIAASSNENAVNVYPNPYSEFTAITLNLQSESEVSIEVYNVLGEKITSLANSRMQPGEHIYKFGAKQMGFSSGVYLVKVIMNGEVYITRIIENK